MSDDPTNPGPEDGKRIAMKQLHERRYWMKEFGVTRKALDAAILLVGNSSANVRRIIKLSHEIRPPKPKNEVSKAD